MRKAIFIVAGVTAVLVASVACSVQGAQIRDNPYGNALPDSGSPIASRSQAPVTAASETTNYIGARWDWMDKDGWITAASFRPNLSDAEAIAIAKRYLKQGDGWDADTLHLPVKATVALFTGKPQTGGPWVNNLKANIVVFDHIPIVKAGPPDATHAVYQGDVRFTMVIDGKTGKLVYGTIIGGTAELTKDDLRFLGDTQAATSMPPIDSRQSRAVAGSWLSEQLGTTTVSLSGPRTGGYVLYFDPNGAFKDRPTWIFKYTKELAANLKSNPLCSGMEAKDGGGSCLASALYVFVDLNHQNVYKYVLRNGSNGVSRAVVSSLKPAAPDQTPPGS